MDENRYSKRTQISLSPKLYKEINKRKGNRSMAQYVREAVAEYMVSSDTNQKRQKTLGELIDAISNPLDEPAPSIDSLLKWEREIRKDKDEG